MKKKLMPTLLLLVVLPALAEKPTIILLPFTTPSFAPTAAACGFDILASPTAGRPQKEKLILFANTRIITGSLFETLKNLSTGKTIDVTVPGPLLLSFSGNLVGMGPGILAFPPPPPDVAKAAGLPLVPLIHGRIVFTVDDQGNITSIQSVSGTVQDVCQFLQ